MKEILVAGGAGYVGSHTLIKLLQAGYHPIVVDNLTTGHQKAVIEGTTFYQCDISNTKEMLKIVSRHQIDAVMHFSANCYVGESVVNPHKYFKNNVANTIALLDVMLESGIKKFILSSTAATYGNPIKTPIDETHPQVPCNPYGLSKLMIEQIVNDYEKPYGIKHIYLRYFNAAGSDPDGRIGEDHYPETHIIPLLLKTALGIKKQFTILGNDYDTKDGTCIRDYVHVMDIAEAHVKAINYLESQRRSDVFNLGTSVGYSVKEIIKKVEEITGKTIPVEYAERREGDPAILIASSKKAKEVLEWFPHYNIDHMIESAWKWTKQNPKGYRDVK